MPVCPVCLKECIEIKDDMAIHRYIGEWVANMCVISPRTIASQQSFAPDVAICEDCGKSPAMEGCSVCAECGL